MQPPTPSSPLFRVFSAYISYSRVPSFCLSRVAFSAQRFSARVSSCAWLDGDVTFLSGTIYMQREISVSGSITRAWLGETVEGLDHLAGLTGKRDVRIALESYR